jgi:hypothetical protein
MWGRGPDLYLPVLLKEMCQIWHKIPDDVYVGQGAGSLLTGTVERNVSDLAQDP